FPLVAAWAAHGAIIAGDIDRGLALAARAREAQERLGTRFPWVLAPDGVAAFFRAEGPDIVLGYAQEGAALARSTGDPYEISLALVLLGTAETIVRGTASIDTLEEAVSLARASAPTALSMALSTLAGHVSQDDPERALPIFDEAIEVGTRVDDREGVASAILFRGWIAARTGDWPAALRAGVD